MTEEEMLNNMKMCTLCLSSDERPYTTPKAFLHERDGLHFTLGTSWQPIKGHKDWQRHETSKKLGLIKTL